MCAECNWRFTFAFLIIIVLILIYLNKKRISKFTCDDYPGNMSLESLPEPKRLYSAADVDSLITVNLKKAREDMKGEYTARTTDGKVEFDDRIPDPDYDSNLNVLYNTQVYDDGMPTNWVLPSTPIEKYKPQVGDYYGEQGITPYTKDLYSQSEPDHEPMI